MIPESSRITLPVSVQVQSTVRSSAVAACQACVWDIEDTYLALEMEAAEADDEKQLGSVLPLGAAIPTGTKQWLTVLPVPVIAMMLGDSSGNVHQADGSCSISWEYCIT